MLLTKPIRKFRPRRVPDLASASFYLGENPGSSKVLVNQATAPDPDLGSGLALLNLQALLGDYTAMPGGPYAAAGQTQCSSNNSSAYFSGKGLPMESSNRRRFNSQVEAYETGEVGNSLRGFTAAILRRKSRGPGRDNTARRFWLNIDTWQSVLSRRGISPRAVALSAAHLRSRRLEGKSGSNPDADKCRQNPCDRTRLAQWLPCDRFSLAVMVCPFRSLCHDIRSDMVYAFAGDNVVINEATDSFQEDLSIEELFDQKTILIVTPEKLLYLLRRAPELAEQIGLVVYDEGHQFDSGARGVTYELLLTSLKLLLAPGTQII